MRTHSRKVSKERKASNTPEGADPSHSRCRACLLEFRPQSIADRVICVVLCVAAGVSCLRGKLFGTRCWMLLFYYCLIAGHGSCSLLGCAVSLPGQTTEMPFCRNTGGHYLTLRLVLNLALVLDLVARGAASRVLSSDSHYDSDIHDVQLALQEALLQDESPYRMQGSMQEVTHNTSSDAAACGDPEAPVACDPRHVQDAEEWRLAAAEGSPWGQTHLGYCYIMGAE